MIFRDLDRILTGLALFGAGAVVGSELSRRNRRRRRRRRAGRFSRRRRSRSPLPVSALVSEGAYRVGMAEAAAAAAATEAAELETIRRQHAGEVGDDE